MTRRRPRVADMSTCSVDGCGRPGVVIVPSKLGPILLCDIVLCGRHHGLSDACGWELPDPAIEAARVATPSRLFTLDEAALALGMDVGTLARAARVDPWFPRPCVVGCAALWDIAELGTWQLDSDSAGWALSGGRGGRWRTVLGWARRALRGGS